jgi:hypothetical protein
MSPGLGPQNRRRGNSTTHHFPGNKFRSAAAYDEKSKRNASEHQVIPGAAWEIEAKFGIQSADDFAGILRPNRPEITQNISCSYLDTVEA